MVLFVVHMHIKIFAHSRICGTGLPRHGVGEIRSIWLCPVRGKNTRKFLLKNVSQGDDPVTIQTAGNHSSVAEDTEMISQSVAEHMIAAVRGILIGPDKAVTPLQK